MIVRRNTIMAVCIGIVGLLAVIGLAIANITADEGENELQFVHVVMRHGTRTPASTYPNDPYIHESFYPIGWGQLTNAGKLLQYNTGKYLRERYGKFLGDNYYPDEYYTQSTDVDRTKASVQLTNAGLWPPSAVQTWGPIDWQPVPVHAQPLDQDDLLLVRVPCARYHQELNAVKQSKEVRKLYDENQELFRNLQRVTNMTVKEFDDVQDIYTTLKAEESFNLTLPSWITEYYPEKMEFASGFSYYLTSYNDQLRRLKGGPLLKKITEDWKAKRDGTIRPKSRKAVLYGGHDFTIANILGALKVLEPHTPDYGVAVLLELYKNTKTNDYWVEIFYRNSTEVAPTKLTLPGCSTRCPLDKVLELTKAVIPGDFAEECKTDEDVTIPTPIGP
ncbi:prostatic acid phosphatase isoform X2 [Aethina tumida]|nr:prostatic acid phosphatase isoform X2 [Aethina tumida]XP_019877721.2 prostatic acid phosphatase isoform X2 [Aethina tumida]